MSSLFAVCPAPFQHSRKKGKNAKRNKRKVEATLPPIFDHFMTANGQQDEPVSRKNSSHSSPHALTEQPSPHQHHHPLTAHPQCTCENDSQQSATSSASNESRSTHTSGYQSSGYQTDDGTFEGKMLKRASRYRPANLRMTAIRDYNPCCNEELAVRRGQRVKVLYKNNDWVYAVTKAGTAGYIPYAFVRPSRKYAGYQSEPEYCQDTDAYQSGYETDLPVRRPVAHHRTQIGDVVPAYSVHMGFQGTPESHHHHRGGSVGIKHYDSNSPLDQRNLSGYTSAVEYTSSPHSPPILKHHPRPAKSLHCIIDASSSPQSTKDYRPVERKPEMDSFSRGYLEELVVIHDFEAKEEDEVFVGKGERVRVLNADDPFWLWVETTPGDQGFVPRTCCSLGNHPFLQSSASRSRSGSVPRSPTSQQQQHQSRHAKRYYGGSDRSKAHLVARQARSQAKQRFHELARLRNNPQNPILMEKDEIQRIGSKLIVLMNYTATRDDELCIEFAETIFADVLKQAGADRIWAFCPRTDKCGFVPVSLVVPPVV